MRKLKKILLIIWELPQNVLGFIFSKISRAKYLYDVNDAHVYVCDINGGLSLGRYIFIYDVFGMGEMVKHEYGHTIQSKYLGWLYLFVIGIPSFIWCNFFEEYRKKTGRTYSWFYTESWADKLGGVERED